MHAEMWHERLRDEPRFQAAVEELWPYALGVLPAELRGELVSRVGLDRGRVRSSAGRTPTSSLRSGRR